MTTNRMTHWRLLIAVLALLWSSSALAADPKKSPPADPSPEARAQMAAVHQKMADCLRSTRPIAECRAEMAKSCHEMMGDAGCPMMGSGAGGMGPGMMGGGTMKGPPAETPEKK